MSEQPKWRLISNLGDENPLDYGGYFILTDETGVYPAEGEYLEVDEALLDRLEQADWKRVLFGCDYDPDNLVPEEAATPYTVYRFILEPCTYVNGILSDNRFHPEHAAWWAAPEAEKANRPQDTTYLSNIAGHVGAELDQIIGEFCSDDPLERAVAYRAVGDYHGFDNLDSYPLKLTRAEAKERYASYLKTLKEIRNAKIQ